MIWFGPVEVQVLGVHVDLPSSDVADVLTKDGARFFFKSTMRDASGSCNVSVTESGALGVSGATSRDVFLQQLRDGELQFCASTVRCVRRVRQDSEGTYVNVYLAAATSMNWEVPTRTTEEQIVNACQLSGTAGTGTAPAFLEPDRNTLLSRCDC